MASLAAPLFTNALAWLRGVDRLFVMLLDERMWKAETTAAQAGDVVAYVRKNPDSVRAKYIGCLPLHAAARSVSGEHGVAIINALLTAYPLGAIEKTVFDPSWAATAQPLAGVVPLHVAVTKQASGNGNGNGNGVFDALLRACPGAAREKDDALCLPLHYAALFQSGDAGVAMVTALLDVYPGAAVMADKNMLLPLHMAADGGGGTKGCVAVLQTLLTAYPQGAQEADEASRIPLHIVASCQSGNEAVAMVEALLVVYPQGILQRDRNGDLPLHCAVQHYPSGKQSGQAGVVAVVNTLLAAYPHAAAQANNKGQLPLHYAVKHQRGEHGVRIVKALLAAYPAAAHTADNEGYLPLHVAVTHQSGDHDVALIEALLTAYPHAVTKTSKDKKLPLDCLCDNANSAAVGFIALLQDAITGKWQPAPAG